MDKRPSSMQGNFDFSKSGETNNNFQLESINFRFVLWGLLRGAGSRAPGPIHLPLKVRRGRSSVRPKERTMATLVDFCKFCLCPMLARTDYCTNKPCHNSVIGRGQWQTYLNFRATALETVISVI